MSVPLFDPALLGIWLLPGQSQTYEITPDGGYHIADAEAPLSFEGGGTVMIWGGHFYRRTDGSGETPIGTWREDNTGDGWDFTPDQGYAIMTAGPEPCQTFTGIWALRDGGTSLWTREHRAELSADGAYLTFRMMTGETFRYGYLVTDGVLSLLDAENWTELTRYVSATRAGQDAATA